MTSDRTSPTVTELMAVWGSPGANPASSDTVGWFSAVLDRLADGMPATPGYLAERTGLDAAGVSRRFAAAAAAGYEVTDQGIVGAALTLNPTRHEFTVRGRTLHTWCGFDALFLPLLLGEPARVRSACPVTAWAITLGVAVDGRVHDVDPVTTVVAVVGRAMLNTCRTTGPDSAACTQMPLLASSAAGRTWLAGRAGVAVVDLETAARIARAYVEAGR
jgi:alkylmercury lyase